MYDQNHTWNTLDLGCFTIPTVDASPKFNCELNYQLVCLEGNKSQLVVLLWYLTAKFYKQVFINTTGGFYTQFTSNSMLKINPQARKDNYEATYEKTMVLP